MTYLVAKVHEEEEWYSNIVGNEGDRLELVNNRVVSVATRNESSGGGLKGSSISNRSIKSTLKADHMKQDTDGGVPFEESDDSSHAEGHLGTPGLERRLVVQVVTGHALGLEGTHEAHVREEDSHPSDGTQHRNDRDKVLCAGLEFESA